MKASVRIFDKDLNLKGVISNYESLVAEDMWHGAGMFELVINRHKNFTNQLQKGNIITIDNNYENPFIILHREIELSERGKITENWNIRGMELKIVLGRRITIPPAHTAQDNKSGNAGAVMRHYVNNNAINPVDIKRKITQIVADTEAPAGANVSWQSRFKNLAEELTDISVVSGTGWKLTIDPANKKWIFKTPNGFDRTTDQTDRAPVIFSPQLGNLSMTSFMDSDLNFRNMAYVAGQGEGVERRVVEVGNANAGVDRYELFVDARDISETQEDGEDQQVPRPPAEIVADLINRGEQKLAEVDRELFFEGQVSMGRYTERTVHEVTAAYENDVPVNLGENRNLLKDTAFSVKPPPRTTSGSTALVQGSPTNYVIVNRDESTAGWGTTIPFAVDSLKAGTYTLSFEVRTTTLTRLSYIYLIRGGGGANQSFPASSQPLTKADGLWHRYTATVDLSDENSLQGILVGADARSNVGDSFDLRNVKFEEGSMATPWQPAPEDNMSWTDHQFEVGKVDLLSDQNLYNGLPLSQGYSTARGTTTILDRRSFMFQPDPLSTSTPYVIMPYSGVVAGVEYTMSFKLKNISPDGKPLSFRYGMRNGGFADQTVIVPTNEEVNVKHTFTPTTSTGHQLIFFDANFKTATAMVVSDIKIEKGNVATPWKPSPQSNIPWYTTEPKEITLPPIDLSDLKQYDHSIIRMVEDTPDGTYLMIEYTLDEGHTWMEAFNNSPVDIAKMAATKGMSVQFRVTMATTDQFVTPKLVELSLEAFGYTERSYINTQQVQLGKQYNVGDIVTIQNKEWGGLIMHTRVAGARRIYESGNPKVELVFGNNRPTLITKLKQELKNMNTEVTR